MNFTDRPRPLLDLELIGLNYLARRIAKKIPAKLLQLSADEANQLMVAGKMTPNDLLAYEALRFLALCSVEQVDLDFWASEFLGMNPGRTASEVEKLFQGYTQGTPQGNSQGGDPQ
jgi:hypothetical protein